MKKKVIKTLKIIPPVADVEAARAEARERACEIENSIAYKESDMMYKLHLKWDKIARGIKIASILLFLASLIVLAIYAIRGYMGIHVAVLVAIGSLVVEFMLWQYAKKLSAKYNNLSILCWNSSDIVNEFLVDDRSVVINGNLIKHFGKLKWFVQHADKMLVRHVPLVDDIEKVQEWAKNSEVTLFEVIVEDGKPGWNKDDRWMTVIAYKGVSPREYDRIFLYDDRLDLRYCSDTINKAFEADYLEDVLLVDGALDMRFLDNDFKRVYRDAEWAQVG